MGERKRKQKDNGKEKEKPKQETHEDESNAKEFIILMDNLVKLHEYAKYLKRVQLANLMEEIENGKEHLLPEATHISNVATTIRADYHELLAKLNAQPIFYASKIEHLDEISKYMYRKEVHIITDDSVKTEELIEEAQKRFLYVAN